MSHRRTHRPRDGRLIAGVATLNAIGAGLGAVGLASGWLDLGPTVTARLPWSSAVLGGAALALVVAVPNTVLAVLTVRRDARYGPASIVAGAVLVGWIVVELAFIRELSFFHPLYTAVGILQVWLGARVVRETNRRGQTSGSTRRTSAPSPASTSANQG